MLPLPLPLPRLLSGANGAGHAYTLTGTRLSTVLLLPAGKEDLGRMLAYNPGLSSAWMLQRAMSIQRQQGEVDPTLINKMLSDNFKAMEALGPEVMMPFLQDVIQVSPLLQTMGKQVTTPASHRYGGRWGIQVAA